MHETLLSSSGNNRVPGIWGQTYVRDATTDMAMIEPEMFTRFWIQMHGSLSICSALVIDFFQFWIIAMNVPEIRLDVMWLFYLDVAFHYEFTVHREKQWKVSK